MRGTASGVATPQERLSSRVALPVQAKISSATALASASFRVARGLALRHFSRHDRRCDDATRAVRPVHR